MELDGSSIEYSVKAKL